MVRLSLTAAALALALPLAAVAQSVPMSDADREAFRAEVRAYLMENPEVIFEAVAEFERRNQEQQASMDETLVELNSAALYADGYSWVGGNPDGDLTLVEFMDYRCGYCRRAHPQVLELLETDGNIRLVVKEFPILGPDSETMSRFAVAVHQLGGDAAYAVAHERLMAWEGDFFEDDIRNLAAELALDADVLRARMTSDAVNAVLAENAALARRLQISGTPTFVMGAGESGELLRGFLPLQAMQTVAQRLRS